ncbi:MAG: TIGR02466 family protein [Caulobacteraceae bacterium]
MAEPARTNYAHIFGSPLMAHRWEDGPRLNAALRSHILGHETSTASAAKTNVGGWHSQIGQLEFCGEAGKALILHMREMGDEATARVLAEYKQPLMKMNWVVDAWANVNRAGHFNRAHTHPGCTWSGTYYVDPGTDPALAPQGTALELFDPCQARASSFLPGVVPSSFTIRPEASLMVLFPSYLAHMVFPHAGAAPRISIAFNLRREPFP